MDDTGFAFGMDGPEQRRITIKPAEFLKGVSKAALKLGVGAYTDALSELPDIAASLGIKATPQKRVGGLILRALERALVKLVGETIKDRDDEFIPDIHAATFVGLSEDLRFEVTRDFFQNPNAVGLVTALKPDAERWLTILGLPENDISNILYRLPSVFNRALHAEWRSNSAFYGEILEATDSPFVGAAIMEQEWTSYRAYLVAMADERVFDESFGLRQIYVDTRCYFFDKQDRSDNRKAFGSTRERNDEPRKVLRWVHEEVIDWIGHEDRDFAIRTIAGGPGSGKSSFAKIIASHLAETDRRVLFVPLHQIDLELGISRALSDYFLQAGHFSEDPLVLVGETPTVLILDGLDEIQMQGRAAQESAQSFVNDLIRFVDRKNTTSCNLMCLITGRDLAVQSAEGSLKIESQVLHLAPYFIDPGEKSQFVDNDGIFDLDQRDEWWRRYGQLTGLGYQKMPETLRAGELNEVTSQPLLNYLVALSYRRGLSLNESTNINSIYEDLLKAVYARAWARHNHPSVKDVPYESFVRLLEEVALSVWHGAGRTTTLAEVELHCQQSKVGALLPSFQSGVSSGVSSLLLAFYFRQKGRRDDGSKTFEFTHKTFAEYLISLRVIRLIELVSSQMAAHDSDPDLGIDEQDALYRWLSVCGQTALDSYLLEFIRRETGFRNAERSAVLQKSLCSMLESALNSGWPVQRIPKLSFTEQLSYVRNAEETLLACLNACALVSREISIVRWPTATSAGEMIARLQGQRKGPNNRPVLDCLSYLNFDGQYLDIADLYGAEMHHSSFIGAELNYTMLMFANLTRASFIGARMEGVNLSSAQLRDARIPIGQLPRIRGGVNRGPILDDGDALRDRKTAGRPNSIRRLADLRSRGVIVIDESGVPMSDEQLAEQTAADVELGRARTARAPKEKRKPSA
jgi:hypothetical protein